MQTYRPSQVEIVPPTAHHAPASLESRGLAGTMGIHPALATFTIAIDWMCFGTEAATFGLSLPFTLLVSSAVGYATFKGQMAWYGDSAESAKAKAIMLAVLTAIPSPLPMFIYVPLGILGLFRKKS